MAVDKNSKAYQNLIENGYTDEQIMQMHSELSWWWKTPKEVINATQPQNPSQRITVWPQNANLNYYQYWDDSNPAQQWQRGWMNQKYTGEGVSNTYIDYNKDLRTADLDPNYLYWENARQQNRREAGYIARRNDNIASALYNEWLTSKEDVANFLSQQNEWMNSTEADRLNTIESVWKRLWQIQPEEEPEKEAPKEKPAMDVEETPGGVIYGRASGDEGTRIETQADPNSPEALSLRARQVNYQSLQAMDSYDIALIECSGASLYWETAMRDLATYDPQKYREIQEYKKQIQAWDVVNAIASGEYNSTTTQADKSVQSVNSSVETWVSQNSTGRTSGQVQDIITNKLASSQVATTATQEMLDLQRQMAEIEETMSNLPKEAKKAFKGDVPQYIIDAYVSNNAQRYQSELNKLQSRYNGAIDLYKTELAQKQWEAEMELKKAQFNSDQNYRNREMSYNNKKLALSAQDQAWNQNYMNQKLKYDNIQEINGEAYVMDASTGKWTKLSDDMAYQSYKTDTAEKLRTYLQMFPDGSDGWQCESFTDAFTYSTTGLKMEGANWGATTAKEKADYVNTRIPEVGSVAVFDYGILQADGVNYWHTMLVSGWDPTTGIITLTGSNRSSKDGEYEKVYTQTMSIDKLNNQWAFKGFWNPYLDKVEQSYDASVTSQYNAYYPFVNTPMTKVIDDLKSNAWTAWERSAIAVWELMYNTMYELESQGYIDDLITSGVMEDFLNAIDRSKFWIQWDDRGSAFLEQLGKYIRNEVKDERVAHAMNRLYTLVEQKLRKESGAAISSSEWAMDFQLFLPQPGQSESLRRKQIQEWDNIIYKEFSWTGMPASKYVPIFDYSGKDELKGWRQTR